jgi:hypothetical protein
MNISHERMSNVIGTFFVTLSPVCRHKLNTDRKQGRCAALPYRFLSHNEAAILCVCHVHEWLLEMAASSFFSY